MIFRRLFQSTRHQSQKSVIFVPCPVCGSFHQKRIHRNPPVNVVRCLRCNTIYLNPRFVNSQQHYWDSDLAYITKKYAKTLQNIQNHPRYANYRDILHSLHQINPSGRFLDVGAHIGNVLYLARDLGYETYGVEPSLSMTTVAKEHRQLNVFHGFLHDAQYPSNFFDIVTLIDVLEHIETPKIFLQEIHRILKPGGIVFIRIPNGSYEKLKFALLYPIFGQHCFDFFATHEHLVHYTQETLKHQVESQGFKEVKSVVSAPNLDSSGPLGKCVSGVLYRIACVWYKISGNVGCFSSGVSGYFQKK